MLININPKEAFRNPWNPNRVDPINQEKLEESLRKDGQTVPIIVRKLADATGYEIIDGEHRVAAALKLGWTAIQAKNLGEISDVVAKKATLIANSRYGDNDPELLYAMFSSEDMESMEELLNTLPIDSTEIEALFSHSDYNFDELEEITEEPAKEEPLTLGDGKPAETTKIIRFKLDAEMAEAVNDKIAEIIIQESLDDSDKLTNAGNALLYLLESQL